VSALYAEDLSHIHHVGFGAFASGAAPGLLRLLRQAGLHRGLVVDLGCGSGLWPRALLHAGYEVVGIDSSRSMLALAATIAPGSRLVEGSLHDIELPPCAAVTAIGEGFSYLGDHDPVATLPGLFRRIHEALVPGGLLLFDVLMRSSSRASSYRSRSDGEGWSVEVEVREDPGTALLTRRILTTRLLNGQERRGEETHRVRTFTREEVEGWLRACGFTVRVLRGYGEQRLAPRRLAFRARKRPVPPPHSRSTNL
jgi:SAM-dependent methyltransferase